MGVPVFYAGSLYKPVPFVPIPVPPTPHFSAAEVGNVNASTVAVTFDTAVDAAGSDYSSGVTINVNASVRAFESGIRQANHAVVYYALATPVENGDTVTWEYASASGHIVAESGGAALEDVTAQEVTNNVAPADPIGDGLRADAVAYWTMNEASGTRVDATTRGNNLAAQNAPVGVAGKVSNAVQFISASNQSITSAATSDLQVGGVSFTLCLWVNFPSVPPAVGQYILSKGDDNSEEYSFFISQLDQLNFQIQAGDQSYPSVTADPPPEANIWYFVVGYFDSVNQQIGVSIQNGTFVTESAPAGQLSDNSPLSIGSFGNGGSYFNGLVDEVGMWKRLLTSDERTYLYNSGAGRALFPAP